MMFSVIIPAYNAADFIRDSVESVLGQTVSDYEIIVVDDGSKDNTGAVIAEFDDPRIHYVHQSNGGVSAARNTGIKTARGEYVCFLDADDKWKPNHLEVISHLIKEFPMCSIYLTGHEVHLHNGEIIEKSIPGVSEDMQCDNVFRHIWEYGYFFNTNCIVCKTSTFDTVGLFEIGVKNGEDDDMWYRLFSYYSAAISNKITTEYVRENSRATVSKIFVEDWVFLHRTEAIFNNSEVSEEKKKYLKLLLEQRKLSFARDRILNGDKKNAWETIRKLNIRLLKPRKYIATIACMLIPCRLIAAVVKRRDRKYFLR